MRVLRNAHRLCRPDGVILDLTTVPPAAGIELDGALLGRLDQRSFLADAATTEKAVELLVADGLLVEETSLAHSVLMHFDSGPDAIEDLGGRRVTRLPDELRETIERIDRPLVERSHCLLRRLRVLAG